MYILTCIVLVTLSNFGIAYYHTIDTQLLEEFIVKPINFTRDGNSQWMHNGNPVNRSSNHHTFLKDGTLKIIRVEASDYGPYQKCLANRCSTPVYAEIQSLNHGIIWIFKNDEPNTYTYRKPATEIQCNFVLLKKYPRLRVNWFYSVGEKFQAPSSDFLIRNHTFPCKRHTCIQSSLILLQNPGDTVFTCRIFAQTKVGDFIDEQDFYPNYSGFSQRNLIRDYDEKVRNKYSFDGFRTTDYLESPPNITLSAEKCGGPVSAACSSKEGLVELYITADVESLDRYNGSWFALPERLLSLRNSSGIEMNGTYFSSHLFNLSEFLSQEVYVVCHCLGKYSFRRLEAQNCSTVSEKPSHLSLVQQCLIIAACLTSIVLLVAVVVWRCLVRRRKLRIRCLRLRPSLIYQSIDGVGYQRSCPQRHDYANISIVYCPHKSGSTKPHFGLAESDEDYLEPRQLESGSTSQTRSIRFHLSEESSSIPKSHKSPPVKNTSRKTLILRQHRRRLAKSPSLSRKVSRKSSRGATVLHRNSLNSVGRFYSKRPNLRGHRNL